MTIHIQTPMPPPEWALLERQLLQTQSDACAAFFDHYFDEHGYLLCVPRRAGAATTDPTTLPKICSTGPRIR